MQKNHFPTDLLDAMLAIFRDNSQTRAAGLIAPMLCNRISTALDYGRLEQAAAITEILAINHPGLAKRYQDQIA